MNDLNKILDKIRVVSLYMQTPSVYLTPKEAQAKTLVLIKQLETLVKKEVS